MITSVALFFTLITAPLSGICPEPSAQATDEIIRKLENDESFRTEIGASPNEYLTVEALTDESTCDILQLSAATFGISHDDPNPRFRYVYVRSDKFFFIVSIRKPIEDDLLYFALAPLFVLNSQYQLLQAYLR